MAATIEDAASVIGGTDRPHPGWRFGDHVGIVGKMRVDCRVILGQLRTSVGGQIDFAVDFPEASDLPAAGSGQTAVVAVAAS